MFISIFQGSDLSDYFNYGFTEDTWNAYCQRQRRMRTGESGVGMPNMANPGSSIVPNITPKIISSNTFSGGHIPTLGVTSNNGTMGNRIISSIATSIHKPPPAIPVVESPAPIAVMTSDKRNYPAKKVMETIDFSMPPPGLAGLIPPGPPPTFDGPPPVFDGPPPSLMPPGMPPPLIGEFVGDDPFGYNYGGYEPTQESQWSLPPPAESFHPPPGDVPPGDPSYDDRGDRDAWGRGRSSRDKSPTPRSYDRRDADRDGSSRRRRRSRSRYFFNSG
jgi:pre-mRNA 3'-end-processing factor FIP1